MTSAPPPPSTVSLPEPVTMVFADVEPITFKPVVKTLASRFSKCVTLTASPMVWSALGATAKSTVVMPPDAASTRVSDPLPPSIEISVP